MKPRLHHLALASLLILLQVTANVQSNSLSTIASDQEGDELKKLDTEGNEDLEEWLAANIRTPPSLFRPCPFLCSRSINSTDGAGWFLIPEVASLAKCNETLLLDLVFKSDDVLAVRACTADYGSDHNLQIAYHPDDAKAALCPTPNHDMVKASIRLSEASALTGNGDLFLVQHLESAGRQVFHHLRAQKPSCTNNAVAFGYSQSAVVGVFAGAELHQHGLVTETLDSLLKYAAEKSMSKTTVIQLCREHGLGADYALGIVTTSARNLGFAQEAVKTWANGKCVDTGGEQIWKQVTIRIPSAVKDANMTASPNATATRLGSRSPFLLVPRAECKTATVRDGEGCWAMAQTCGIKQSELIKYNPRPKFCRTLIAGERVCCTSGTLPSSIPASQLDGTCVTMEVKTGDSCGSMASKCGISPNDFMTVNTKKDICSTLVEGQQVCCSRGELPDRRPKPEPDGTCASVKTNPGDSCASIAASHDLTVNDIENFNKKTWGWNGCKVLWLGFRLCVSEGNPPMPEPVSNAVCGPTVPGTKAPAAGTDLSKLNPCPLRACCNVWGQCGLSDDFCIESESETGAPGTSGVKNGCISNCGRSIIRGPRPARKINIAYFEAWNHKRSCLTMDVTQIDTTKYSHIHFAFAEVTRDFDVDISKVQEQFDMFKTMTGVKKIISFGGWDFSTLPDTYNILREAVQPVNRNKFKNNIIAFVNQHGLDGVDLDWEYPGAPDIPDIPADDPQNGLNYYKLLSLVKSELGGSKSVSFAAPSSYWYLKAFPIILMAKSLDYIVFMTYDLHGQWDYGNKWTSSGCPTGNCLRSHVNHTETLDALAMITKAGAPSNKVVVGVASYGRSFQMAEAGCHGPLCKFTGTARISNAAKGRCTDTAGYISNAEIAEIIASDRVNKRWIEAGSNIMIYDDTEWVAYMDDNIKAVRSKVYDFYSFAGTTDWAVDLQEFLDGSVDSDDAGDGEMHIDADYFSNCGGQFFTLDDIETYLNSMPVHCIEQYITEVQVSIMREALKQYENILDKGYDNKFKTYERFVKDQVPLQIDAFMASDRVHRYFECTESRVFTCCTDCTYVFCLENCKGFAGCKSGYQTLDIKCPQEEKKLDMLDVRYIPNATFTLTDDDGFWKEIGEKYGIEKSWVDFGRRRMRTSNGCQFAGKDINKCIDKKSSWWYNYPYAPRDMIKVYNPKEIFGESRDQVSTLVESFETVKDWNCWDHKAIGDAVLQQGCNNQFSLSSIQGREKGERW
ncbi:Glycoside hydrolase, subgroup, catalytic core, partial [Metarhizium majus ARSEF 297]